MTDDDNLAEICRALKGYAAGKNGAKTYYAGSGVIGETKIF